MQKNQVFSMPSTGTNPDVLSTQELEALGTQLNADMEAKSYAWTQYQPSEDHRSLELFQQWQAGLKGQAQS